MTNQMSDQAVVRANELNTTREAYNQLPYQSFPYPKSSPAYLRTIGTLFGMEAPPLETARVLELGCAAGGNIIPLAAQYPQATWVGVDLSDVQISAGREFIGHLGLNNIELKACSITDIDSTIGPFDYIIAHGVFSWVPEFVREHIMMLCRDLLTPSGIAYISYNTLPGWNTRRIIRDLALYHGKHFEQTGEKIQETKELLSFISDALAGSDDSYAKLIMESVSFLKDKQDYYIAHDFLEANNTPFYFSEFISMAERYDLKYLAEASIPSMYLGNYSDAINATLSQISDINKTEQYLDFITNRNFRSTLLCHRSQDDIVDRTLRKESLQGCYVKMSIVAGTQREGVDLSDDSSLLDFDLGADRAFTLSTASPVLKALFYTFSEWGNTYVFYDDLVRFLANQLKDLSEQVIREEVDATLINLFLTGRLDIRRDGVPITHRIPDKPKVWLYAAAQCRYLDISFVTNMYHEPVPISMLEKFLITLLDGGRSEDEIVKILLEQVKSKKIDLGVDLTHSEERTLHTLRLAYLDSIEKFTASALLV
jgi:methyltransferase-like protein/SAM-dependent methyltransferase